MFSSLSRRRLVALLVLTCLLLITLDRNDNPVFARVRRVFGVVMEPFETAARVVALPISRAWNSFTNYDDLADENERLRDIVENQRGAEAVAVANQLRLNDLLAINRLPGLNSYPSLISRVVGEAPGNFQNSVEINVGARDGIAVGMPVTDGSGLVGRISQVKSSSSVVLLITDPGFHISAEVLMADQGDTAAAGADPNAGVPNAADPNASDPNNTVPNASDPSNTDPSATTTTAAPSESLPANAAPDCAGLVAALPNSTTSSTTTTSTIVPVIVPANPADTTTTIPVSATTTTTTTTPSVIRETGTLSGQTGEKPLLLEHVDDSSGRTNLCLGALVSTAGGGGSLAPQGIPIGKITRIDRANRSGSRSPIVEVTPNAKLSQLNFVAVVLFVPHDESG